MKVCNNCKQSKSLDFFYLSPTCKGGVDTVCKVCKKERSRIWAKENSEKRAAILRRWYRANLKSCDASARRWQRENPEKYAKINRRWRNNNPKWVEKNKISFNLRTRIWGALKGHIKLGGTFELVGCSAIELQAHLQRLFKPGMSWENYGLRGWEVDHIRPCALFDLSDPEQQRACFHYTNLQPLWKSENRKKGAKF